MPVREIAYIGLGSNLGDRRSHLRTAIRRLNRMPGVSVTGVSQVYETSPVGGEPAGPYLNAAVRVLTTRAAGPLLTGLLGIEKRMGRKRAGVKRNAPRVIDLDLLLHGRTIRQSLQLSVPHPRLHLRKFALKPLLDLDPDLIHPKSHRSLRSVLAGLPSSQKIRPVRMRRA